MENEAVESMKPNVVLAWASLICFGLATIVTTVTAYTPSENPLALLFLATVLFLSAGLFGSLSIAWYLARKSTSLVTSHVSTVRYRLGRWLEELEEKHSTMPVARLSKLVVPPDRRSPEEKAAESLSELRARYVEGRLTEHEFEEELTVIFESEFDVEL